MRYDLLMKNCLIPDGDAKVAAEIAVKDGKIAAILEANSGAEAEKVLDIGGKLVLPGCIDSHTHYMDPGFTHRETFAHGTRGAAVGGVTTIIDMPCCSVPSVRDIPSLHHKLEKIAPEAYVDFALWGGVTGEDVREGKLENVQKQADEGVVAYKAYMTPSVPTYPRSSDYELTEIFAAVAKTGLPVGVHCENFDICDHNVKKLQAEGRMDGPAWAEARCEMAEKAAIQLCIDIAEETGARMHVVHMSTGIGAILIEEAKLKGRNVSAETCPHYLTLNAQDAMTERGSFAKIAPPLRTVRDNEILWEKLESGAVDFIATDHAPYEIATEKAAEGMNIWNSFPGIPGTETMAPVIISEGYNKGRLSLHRLVEVLSTNAAKHYGLYPKKGALLPGSDADFTVVDLEKEWTIDETKTQCKAKYTPLHGMKLKGAIDRTIVRGEVVYENGEIVGQPGYGQFVKRQTISSMDRKIKY